MNNRLAIAVFLIGLMPGFALAAVNINTADAALLDTLPGIGPTKAAAIIEYRTAHGLFARAEDIQEVKGIGPATYADLQALITVTGGESAIAPKPMLPKVQPAPVPESSNESTNLTEPAHAEKPVTAPGAATNLAAPGAASVLSSPWTLGFLGVLVIAGAALLIL